MENKKKRQVLPPGLWVVATPIGNLADLSARARDALSEAAGILCEDTRRTGELLVALGIQGVSLYRFDAHAEPEHIEKLIESLQEKAQAGEALALVTDAGTPGISDPGALLVRAARAAGIAVTAIPGPSAVAVLLSVAGFPETEFAFRGFFPRKEAQIKAELARAASSPLGRVCVWYESPQRIDKALAQIAALYPHAELAVAKELTKLHERFFWGASPAVSADVAAEIAREGTRGEWCLALRFVSGAASATDAAGATDAATATGADTTGSAESSEWVKALHCLVECRVSASVAARQVSQYFGVSKKPVYEMALKLSGKKSH